MAQPNDLVTKSFLKTELKKEFGKIRAEMKGEFKKSEDRVVERIIKEIKDMQEDTEVHQFSHTRINDDLEELDVRVGKLEKPTLAHS